MDMLATSVGPTFTDFLWGIVGVAVSLMVTQYLPALARIRAEGRLSLSRVALLSSMGYLVFFVVIGIVVTKLFRPMDGTDALKDGLAWQALLGGVITTFKEGAGVGTNSGPR